MSDWSVAVGARRVPVTVRRSRRRTVALHLLPGPRLEVRAPRQCPDSVLRAFVGGRRAWVERHIDALPPPLPTPTYTDGERHPFLGVDYPLALDRGPRRRVSLREGRLRVTVPEPTCGNRVEAALRAWYRAEAEAVFTHRIDLWRERLADWSLPPSRLRLRRMRARWGSCASTGVITLNTRLVERAESLIDLVVVHELCHLLEFNHSPAFHRLMDSALPDWRERARRLDGGHAGLVD